MEACVSLGELRCVGPGWNGAAIDLTGMQVLVPLGADNAGILLLFGSQAIATAVAHGRMTLTEAAPVEARAPGGNDGEEKRRLQSQLLKIHSVSHGDKAIDRWLHENWRGELLERWGPPDTGAAIRRWESRQRRRSGRQPTES